MANTTNFGWETPDDTDLVKDGAAAMRTLGNSIDSSFVDLKGGTTGQILSKNSNTDLDYVWINNDQGDITAVTAGTGISGGGTSGAVTITNSMATEITASGDIIVGTGSGTFDNLPIGTTGQVLTADTTVSPYKVKWANAGSSFVGVSAARDASFSVSSATATAISLNSTDQWDTDSIHNPSVNPTRFTIPTGKGGYWSANIGLLIAGQTSSGAIRLLIYKNGATWLRRFVGTVTANVGESEFAYSEVINVAAGDYIEFYVWQNVWSSITCYCATSSTGEKQGTAQLSYLGA